MNSTTTFGYKSYKIIAIYISASSREYNSPHTQSNTIFIWYKPAFSKVCLVKWSPFACVYLAISYFEKCFCIFLFWNLKATFCSWCIKCNPIFGEPWLPVLQRQQLCYKASSKGAVHFYFKVVFPLFYIHPRATLFRIYTLPKEIKNMHPWGD